MFDGVKVRWQTFEYNFTWADYTAYLNGPIARTSYMIPLIGYAVIFNDYVTDNVTFSNLANEVSTTFFLNSADRVRFLFFGFIIIAAANLAYKALRPKLLKFGENQRDFNEHFLSQATAETFLQLHLKIRGDDFDPLTLDGKYYDDDWDLFWREARWSDSGKNYLKENTDVRDFPDYLRVDFEDAKRRHKSLLLSILRETYFRESRKKRPQLIFCLALCSVGYLLLLVPSVDLTLRVLELTIQDLWH